MTHLLAFLAGFVACILWCRLAFWIIRQMVRTGGECPVCRRKSDA
jgi:hypothetical protein